MSDPIDVNLDPEGEQPKEEIVIRKEDLRPRRSEPAPEQYIPPHTYTPIRRSLPAMMVRGLVGRNLIAALGSAFVVGILLQIFIRDSMLAGVPADFGLSALVTSLYIAAAAGAVGAAVAAAEPVSQANYPRATSRAVTGLVFGVAGGLIGGLAAQLAGMTAGQYGPRLGNQQDAAMLVGLLGSFVGWGVAGFAIGIGRGYGFGRGRMANGVISGIIGGVVGGLLVGLSAISFDSAAVARMLGLLGFGVAVGGAAAGTDETRRDIWLLVLDGPLQGADFTLYQGHIRIGSSQQCQIVLPGPMVAPIHCNLDVDYSQILFTNLSREFSTLINGQRRDSGAILPGDVLQIGANLLRCCEKEG